MSEYRDSARVAAKETSWTFWRFLPIGIVIIVVFSGLGFGLKSLGLIGGTIVERKVFEESYQRSESLKSSIANDQATIIEIEGKLLNPNLDKDTRFNLNAQLSAANSRINAKRMQQ